MVHARILVVEDEAVFGGQVVGSLQDVGYVVAWAKTGYEALKQIQDFQPDLILLDLHIPEDIDGFALAPMMKRRLQSKKPVLIVMSERYKYQEPSILRDLIPDDFLAKPFELDVLRERVKLRLRGHVAGARLLVVDELELAVCRRGRVFQFRASNGRMFELEDWVHGDQLIRLKGTCAAEIGQ